MAAQGSERAAPEARPFTAFRFEVEITLPGEHTAVCGAAFSECEGLEMSIEPKTIREGGRNLGPVHLVGPVSYGQLTLKRGMTSNFDLWQWFERVVQPGNRGIRPTAEIVMKAADGSEQARFVLVGCLPVKLKAPALNAKDGIVAVEEMQLVYESMSLRSPSRQQGAAPAAATA
jgi:phage tail-like protein